MKESTTALHSLVRAGDGFRVFDPSFVTETDTLHEWRGRLERDDPYDVPAVLGVLVLAIGLSLALGASWLSYLLWFLAGAGGGLVAFGVLSVSFGPDTEDDYERRRGDKPFRTVDEDPEALEACRLAERIAGTAAWRDRVIDPEHSLATVLWSVATGREKGEDVAATVANLRELARIGQELDRGRGGAVAEAMRTPAERARDLSGEMLDHGRTVHELSGEGDAPASR